MFGRKKKHAQFNTMDDSRVTVYDFKRRIQCLFESYRSTDYRLYPGLSEEEMKPKIDRHLEALFAGDVDDGNGAGSAGGRRKRNFSQRVCQRKRGRFAFVFIVDDQRFDAGVYAACLFFQ